MTTIPARRSASRRTPTSDEQGPAPAAPAHGRSQQPPPGPGEGRAGRWLRPAGRPFAADAGCWRGGCARAPRGAARPPAHGLWGEGVVVAVRRRAVGRAALGEAGGACEAVGLRSAGSAPAPAPAHPALSLASQARRLSTAPSSPSRLNLPGSTHGPARLVAAPLRLRRSGCGRAGPGTRLPPSSRGSDSASALRARAVTLARSVGEGPTGN